MLYNYGWEKQQTQRPKGSGPKKRCIFWLIYKLNLDKKSLKICPAEKRSLVNKNIPSYTLVQWFSTGVSFAFC